MQNKTEERIRGQGEALSSGASPMPPPQLARFSSEDKFRLGQPNYSPGATSPPANPAQELHPAANPRRAEGRD